MFVEVLVNHSYARKQERLTYSVPKGKDLQAGSGVVVPFRNSKLAGLVLNVHDRVPDFKTKDILQALEPNLLLLPWQLELAQWISEYYFCSTLDVTKMFLPKHIWRVPKREQKRTIKKTKAAKEIIHELTPAQAEIIDDFLENKPKISLIYGVTGAGKTELYKKMIQKNLKEGKQALLMVPEISLTPQFIKYFKAAIPELTLIHSKISEGKKAEAWKSIRAGKCKLVIGSRSSLFAPFKDLGLIIMDEEHEWSYKQDQSPRYHAKTVAKKIAKLTNAQLIFGSATPSIESMWEAKSGAIHLYTLKDRVLGTALPKVHVVDLREELKAGNMGIFSELLEQKMRTALDKKEQIILFLNRRGNSSATVCRDCGSALECNNCDVNLTYHTSKFKHSTLICHHCGIMSKMPKHCPQCKSIRIRHFGVGTQKVEEELKKLFPNARIKRADKDTMSARDAFKKLHAELHNDEVDILLGTQMIGKGFDLPKVSLVGVILADIGIHMPDFRASERAFQLLTQVAGRAGRRETQGEVVIQTYTPDHPSIALSENHDYDSFYEQEISSRESNFTPPFGKLLKLIFVDPDQKACQAAVQRLLPHLKDEEHQVYAAPALIPRIHNKYHWHILIQGPNPSTLIKKIAQEELEGWRIDVDPLQTV